MNASETTKSFSLAVFAGTTYVSWTVPWKAMTWAGAARLPLCSRACRCHPPCLPPSPAAAAERGTASAKNNEPPSRAARAVPVPQLCSAPCVFPVDLRISAMLFINCSIINQTQSLAALNEQPVSSAPTATSPLPSQLPCFIARHNTGACIQSLLIIAARGAFQMISSHRESRHSSCQTGRKRGISIQVNASFLPVIPPATWLKSCSHSEIKYLAVLCFPTLPPWPVTSPLSVRLLSLAFSSCLSPQHPPLPDSAPLSNAFFSCCLLSLMYSCCCSLSLPLPPHLSPRSRTLYANKIVLCCFHEQRRKRNLDFKSPSAQIYQI